MAISDTSRSQLRYAEETTWNTIPAVAFKEITHTGESLAYNINTAVSAEIRSDRQITDLVQTDASSTGGINFELRAAALNDFIEGALFSDWSTTVAISGTDIAAVNSGNKFTSTVTDFTAENLSVGQWVEVAGFTLAANNGYAKIVSIAANELVVSGLTLADESAGDTVTMNGSMIRNGTTRHSYVIEKEFADITEFLWHSGMMVNNFSLSVSAGSIATATLDFLGAGHGVDSSTQGTGSHIAAVTGPLLNGVNNVNAIREGGTPIAAGVYIQSLDLSLANNLRAQQAIGSLAPVGIGLGQCNVTGTINVFYANSDLYEKFVNGTSTSISFRMSDADGKGYIITLPNIEFTGGSPNASGANSDVVVPLAFQALRDTTTDCSIQIDYFA